MSVGVGDEGGFAPHVKSNEEPFELIVEAISRASLQPGKDMGLACDPASSEFFENGCYHLRREERHLEPEEMVAYCEKLTMAYPLVLLEDGMDQSDWPGWKQLNAALGERIELVGDDVFCTNRKLIARGIDENIANAVLIKLNQIGAVTETIAAIRLAQFRGRG